MALMICPDCKNKVSDRASMCPVCGFPVAQAVAEAMNTRRITRADRARETVRDFHRSVRRAAGEVIAGGKIFSLMAAALAAAIGFAWLCHLAGM